MGARHDLRDGMTRTGSRQIPQKNGARACALGTSPRYSRDRETIFTQYATPQASARLIGSFKTSKKERNMDFQTFSHERLSD
jgi:hypothetical protein